MSDHYVGPITDPETTAKGDEWKVEGGFKLPETSEWKCYLFGMHSAITIRPRKNQHPNWFWRKMQYLCFGNEWKKEPELPRDHDPFPWRNAS